MKCPLCNKRPVASIALGKCEVCLYAATMGLDKATLQVELAERVEERAKAKR